MMKVVDELRRTLLSLPVAAGALVILVGLLAVLQFRWVGQLSDAERLRLRAGARSRADDLARDFDREITRALLTLAVRPDPAGGVDAAAYVERYGRWRARARHPRLVQDVFLAQRQASDPSGAFTLRRFDPQEGAFLTSEWPPTLTSLRERLQRAPGPPRAEGPRGVPPDGPPPARPDGGPRGPGPGGGERRLGREPWDLIAEEIPALLAPAPGLGPERVEPGGFFRRLQIGAYTIVVLDREVLWRAVLPDLAARHFSGSSGALEYQVVVHSRSAPGEPLFNSAQLPAPSRPDAETTFFDLRADLVSPEDLDQALPPFAVPGGNDERQHVHPRLPFRPRGAGLLFRGAADGDGGRWLLQATHRAGSVDTLVAAARRRNLAVSLGALLLLAASVVLIVAAAHRARRLAERQVAFVTAISHELRTPVTVICSTGENLADGLVRDTARVREYGAIVRDNGRRLAEMIERVLEFAGSGSGRAAYRFATVAVDEIIKEALAGSSPIVAAGAFVVETAVEPNLPLLRADHAALARALANLIENAVKYSADGRTIRVRATRAQDGARQVLRLAVEDHGLGIPRDEQRAIFEPFYRGREAVSRQIRGSGLGLALVQRVVEAHGGRVALESTPSEGSTFTLTLPALAPEATADVSPEKGATDNGSADPGH